MEQATGRAAAALTAALEARDSFLLASTLAAARWQELERAGPALLRAASSSLDDDAVRGEPRALLNVARAAEALGDSAWRTELLGRLRGCDAGDEAVRVEVDAEEALDLARDGRVDEADALASGALSRARPDQIVGRGRSLAASGRAAAFRGDPESLLLAENRLGEAAALFAAAGETEWRSLALGSLGYRVCLARGDLDRAVAYLTTARELLPPGHRQRANHATFLAAALIPVGHLDAAEAAAGEAWDMGSALGDQRVQGYAAWMRARIASLRRDASATLEWLRVAERYPGDWLGHPTGIEFLADAADMLLRVGETEAAGAYLERAERRADEIGHPEISWFARGALEARAGDPLQAEEVLVAFESSPQQQAVDEWRTLLVRAYAAHRREAPEAGQFAARAFAGAAGLGRPELPYLFDPDIAATLSGRAPAPAVTVSVLGGFAVEGAGAPPPGQPAQLVKLLALANRPLLADEVIETLWPDTPADTGRRRLRNLLNRLRAASGDLAVRSARDDSLTLAAGVRVDARLFEDAAEEASGPEAARAALALYRGDLLPEDRYADWAAAPRERLRRRALELIDTLVADARDSGDLDRAVRLLDRAIEVDPLGDGRLLDAAELLLQQGRRGAARSLVDRAAALRDELGLPPGPRLERLRTSVGRSSDA